MRTVTLIFFLFLGSQLHAQRFFTTYSLGASAYRGDLQESPLNFLQAKGFWGLGCMFECNERMYINLDFNYAMIAADDRFNPRNRARNLNFKTNVAEIAARFEYNLFDLYQYKATPYFFVGFGAFRFNPYYDLENGSRIYLSEYDTEGQGFYDGRQKYDLTQWCIPYGGGVQFAISQNTRLGLSLGLRYTPTDYLDDVSKTYVDKDLLIRKKGGNAPRVAYKGDLLPNGASYPAGGTSRGNPSTKDSYYLFGASLKIRYTAKGRNKKNAKRGSVACPY